MLLYMWDFFTTFADDLSVTNMPIMESELFLIIPLALVLMVIVFYIRIGIAYRMAKNRNRDPLGWVLLSVFVSPLLTWIILLCVGDRVE